MFKKLFHVSGERGLQMLRESESHSYRLCPETGPSGHQHLHVGRLCHSEHRCGLSIRSGEAQGESHGSAPQLLPRSHGVSDTTDLVCGGEAHEVPKHRPDVRDTIRMRLLSRQ